MSMVQHRRWQQFNSNNRTREYHCDTDDKRFRIAIVEEQGDNGTNDEENNGASDAHECRVPYHIQHFRRFHVQADKEEQEDNAKLRNTADEFWIIYKGQTRRSKDHARKNVNNEQRLAGEKG